MVRRCCMILDMEVAQKETLPGTIVVENRKHHYDFFGGDYAAPLKFR